MDKQNQPSPLSSSSSSSATPSTASTSSATSSTIKGIRNRKIHELINSSASKSGGSQSHSSPSSPTGVTSPSTSPFKYRLNTSDPLTSANSSSSRKPPSSNLVENLPRVEDEYEEDEVIGGGNDIYNNGQHNQHHHHHLSSSGQSLLSSPSSPSVRDTFISRKHLHKTIDSYNNLYKNDNITNINPSEMQSTSIQFFTTSFFTVEIYKWFVQFLIFFILLICSFSVGPLMFTPISEHYGTCAWCNVICLEIIISFMMTVSTLFHYTIRRDFVPLLMVFGFLDHTFRHQHPFLEPFNMDLTNVVIISMIAFILFSPNLSSTHTHDHQQQQHHQPPQFRRSSSSMKTTPTASPSITPSSSFEEDLDSAESNNANVVYGNGGLIQTVKYYIVKLCSLSIYYIKSKRTIDKLKKVLLYILIFAIGFLVLFIFTVILVAKRQSFKDHHQFSLSHYIWSTFTQFLFYKSKEMSKMYESMIRLFAILYLSTLMLLYHMRIRKPYTIMSLGSLVGNIAIALYTYERTLAGDIRWTSNEYYTNPYGGGIFYILYVVSTLSFFCGLSIDVLIASSEKYTRWRAEGEKLHRRLSIELNQQSDFVKRVYQNGTQQMMERLDFTQKFVNNLIISTTEASNLCIGLSGLELDKWARQYANSIQCQTNKALNLLDDIKLVLAIESGDIMMRDDVSFNIYSLLEEVFSVISKELKNNEIELVFKVDDNVPLNIIGDPAPILQMITQLLSNAIKYTEVGEVGIIITRLKQPIESPSVLQDQDNVYLEISVFDTGIGMTDQQLINCNEFQPFPSFPSVTQKPYGSGLTGKNDSGTGLGLFICNKIVKIMGGTFEAKHNFGGGMIFSAKITLQEDRTVVTGHDRTSNPFKMSDEQRAILTGLNVLLIDDNSIVRSSTEDILHQLQADIHSVSSTVEAIRELKLAITLLKPFNVVLIDYHMSGCDGLETIQMLRDNPIFDELKLILLLSPSDLLLQNFKSYKFTCITKPLTPNRILEGISQAFNIITIQSPLLPSVRKQLGPKYPFIDTSRSSIRILMGESNQDLQNQVQTIIKPFNHIYTLAVEGSNVVSLAQKNFYDVIIVNLDLPVLNGFEVARVIRQQEKKQRSERDTRESRITKRRDSLGTTSQYITPKIVDNIPIIGISTSPITNDLLVKSKIAGLTSCVTVEVMADFLTNFLLDLGMKKKKEMYSPQKVFSPLLSFDKKEPSSSTSPSNKNSTNNNVNSDVNRNNVNNTTTTTTTNTTPTLVNMPKLQLNSNTPPTTTHKEHNNNNNESVIKKGEKGGKHNQQQKQSTPPSTSSNTPTNQSSSSSSSSLLRKSQNNENRSEQDLSLLDGLHLSGSTLNSKVIGVKMGGGNISNLNILKTPKGRSQKRLQDLENVISRFVPIEFQQLIAPLGMENVYLGDCISKTITIFFSDIRDFTSTTEKMLVDDIIDFLNTYLAFAIPAITEKGGFIDKFIGDAIMAIFPHADVQEQALSAVKAAIGMMKSLDFMSESGFRFNYVETGIGINTGRTIIGIVGTETRMEPTALGDAVNLASRTEPLCKEYGSRILVTQFTVEAIGTSIDEFSIRLVDSVKVKGKSEAVDIYEVLDGERDHIRALKLSILEPYTTGIEYFKNHRFEEALVYFRYCNEIYPGDKPSLLFIQRCLEALDGQPALPPAPINPQVHHPDNQHHEGGSATGVEGREIDSIESDVPGMI